MSKHDDSTGISSPFPGPLHWEPAVPGSQQAVGRGGGLPARLCSHDDETRSGKKQPDLFRFQIIQINKCCITVKHKMNLKQFSNINVYILSSSLVQFEYTNFVNCLSHGSCKVKYVFIWLFFCLINRCVCLNQLSPLLSFDRLFLPLYFFC